MTLDILDSLRDQGVLSESAQGKLLSFIPENAKEKLVNMFQRYQELNDDEKKNLLDGMVGKFKQSLHEKVYSNTSMYTKLFYFHSYTVFFVALLLIVLVLVFFLYKLFKCLSEREMKREEKKKNKQLRKKK